MGGGQGANAVTSQRDDPPLGQRLGGVLDGGGEGATEQQFHDQVRAPLALADRVDLHQAGVAELREDRCLATEGARGRHVTASLAPWSLSAYWRSPRRARYTMLSAPRPSSSRISRPSIVVARGRGCGVLGGFEDAMSRSGAENSLSRGSERWAELPRRSGWIWTKNSVTERRPRAPLKLARPVADDGVRDRPKIEEMPCRAQHRRRPVRTSGADVSRTEVGDTWPSPASRFSTTPCVWWVTSSCSAGPAQRRRAS